MKYKDIADISNIVHGYLKNNDDCQTVAQMLRMIRTGNTGGCNDVIFSIGNKYCKLTRNEYPIVDILLQSCLARLNLDMEKQGQRIYEIVESSTKKEEIGDVERADS